MSGIVGGIQNRNSVVGEAYATTDNGGIFTLKNDTAAAITKPNWTTDALLLDATNLTGNGLTSTDPLNGTPSTKVSLTRGELAEESTWYSPCFQIAGHYNYHRTPVASVSDAQNQNNDFGTPRGNVKYVSAYSTWGSIIGDASARSKTNRNCWFGTHSGATHPARDVWFVIDLGVDRPSVKFRKLVYNITWGTGNCKFQMWGTHTKPTEYHPHRRSTHDGGSAAGQAAFAENQATFNHSSWHTNMGFKKVLDDTLTNPTTTAGKDTGWATSNVDNYRYYAFVIHVTTNVNVAYDFGWDAMKIYGDYY